MTQLIKQVNREGLFASEIIGNRYQVLESDVVKGAHFVYDLVGEDMVRGKDGAAVYFDTVDAATAVAEGAAPAQPRKTKAPKAAASKAPKAAKAAKAPKVAAPKAPKEPKDKRPTANALMMELLKTTELTDKEIREKVLEAFPDCSYCRVYDIKFRRKKLEG